MYNFLIDEGSTLLWNVYLGAYEGIMRSLGPKLDVAILGIAGRGNLNGKPFDGSAAQFALNEVRWLDKLVATIWCLHDERYVVSLFLRALLDWYWETDWWCYVQSY
jgi:hypothetical protein